MQILLVGKDRDKFPINASPEDQLLFADDLQEALNFLSHIDIDAIVLHVHPGHVRGLEIVGDQGVGPQAAEAKFKICAGPVAAKGGKLGQVAADRQHGNADDEFRDPETVGHGDGAANGHLGTEPEAREA